MRTEERAGWSDDHGIFCVQASSSDMDALHFRPRIINRVYISLVLLFGSLAIYEIAANPWNLPHYSILLSKSMGVLAVIPAIVSVPVMRRIVMGKFARDFSHRITDLMGENEDFRLSLRDWIIKTPWFKYVVECPDGKCRAQDVPLYLLSMKVWYIDFESDYSTITFKVVFAAFGTRTAVNTEQIIIDVPDAITRRAHTAVKVMLVFAVLLLPYLAFVFLTEPKPDYDHTSLVEGARYRATLEAYLFPMMLLYSFIVYLGKRLVLRSIAVRLSTLVGASTHDNELRIALRKRLGKSYFIYGAKGVPRPMRRVRLSSQPNADGTYWMMITDASFTRLSFQKYHVGEIKEPNNPDLPSVKYLPGTNPWTDIK